MIVTIADEPSPNVEGQGQANTNSDTKTKEPGQPSQSVAPPSSSSSNDDEAVEVDGSYLVIRVIEHKDISYIRHCFVVC